MAGRAADPLADVDAVVEIRKIRQIVDARPAKRLVIAEAGPHRFENGCIGPELRVAIHAGLGGRNVGKRRLFDAGVAVPAVDAFASDMVCVAELKRLLDEGALVRVVSGEVQHRHDAAEGGGDHANRQDAEPGVDVGGAMKDLTHRVDARANVLPRAYSKVGSLQKSVMRRDRLVPPRKNGRPYNVKLFTMLSNTQLPFQLPVSSFQFPAVFVQRPLPEWA